MINLLSRDEQKKIYREYLLRIATLVFFHMGLIGTVFIVVMVPSYLRLGKEIVLIDTELQARKSQLSVEDQTQVAEAKEFLGEIQVLRSPEVSASAVQVIESIIRLKPARISLLSFQYASEGKGKTSLDIQGKADRREDLLEFKSRLEKEGGYTGIDLPAQTLIKRTDVQFTIKLIPGSTPPAQSAASSSSAKEVRTGTTKP